MTHLVDTPLGASRGPPQVPKNQMIFSEAQRYLSPFSKP